MAVAIGHSQIKYFSEHLPKESYSVFAYPSYRIRQFLTEEVLYDVVPFFSDRQKASQQGWSPLKFRRYRCRGRKHDRMVNEFRPSKLTSPMLSSHSPSPVVEPIVTSPMLSSTTKPASCPKMSSHSPAPVVEPIVTSPMMSSTTKPASCPKMSSHSPAPVVEPIVTSPMMSSTTKPASCPKMSSHSPAPVVEPIVTSPIMSSTTKPASCPKMSSHSPSPVFEPIVTSPMLTSTRKPPSRPKKQRVATLVETDNRFLFEFRCGDVGRRRERGPGILHIRYNLNTRRSSGTTSKL